VAFALLRTRIGKATRAVADNPALAASSGIDVDHVIRVVWTVGAALAALALLEGQPGMVAQLRRNAAVLREALGQHGLDVGSSRTQIVPVFVGDARNAMELCERALEGRVFAQAIRPPTVPDGTSRLRLSVMANHRADELCAAAGVIAAAARELDLGAANGEERLSEAARLPRAA